MFFNVVQNIKDLTRAKRRQRSRTILSISYLCSKENLEKVEEVIELAADAAVDELYLANLLPPDIFTTAEGKKKVFYDDDNEIKTKFKNLKRRHRNMRISFPIFCKKKTKRIYCLNYYKYIGVDAEGNVSGCSCILCPQEKYGNIFKDKKIYNTEHFLKMRELLLSGPEESLKVWPYCEFCYCTLQH